MAQNIPNLWPDDIAISNNLRAPVTILRQQATLLGEKTQNLVVAEVSSENRNGSFWYGFNLVAPALGNYRFRLFSIIHNIDFYPVEIDFFAVDGIVKVESEKAFLEELRKLLSSEETKRIIRALIAQSQA
ncbi:hypothetical protein HYR99_25005 [Candidatus Poribacteria bacterium]|nr:hypothetical protein [Candidatus Poribacteria bacterium]